MPPGTVDVVLGRGAHGSERWDDVEHASTPGGRAADGPDLVPDAATTKAAWRARARRWRATTTDESAAVADHLVATAALAGAGRACLFLPMPGEVDLRTLPSRLPGIHWVTTRTADATTLTLHDLAGPMEQHPFGYHQPRADAPRFDPATVDTWLVPGLAFDRHGTRLGHGRGYYDRLLATAGRHAWLVAVTVTRRVVDRLPAAAHDVPMHLVATEHEVLDVSPPSPGSPGTAR